MKLFKEAGYTFYTHFQFEVPQNTSLLISVEIWIGSSSTQCEENCEGTYPRNTIIYVYTLIRISTAKINLVSLVT